MELNNSTLAHIASPVSVPRYDRSAVSAGIIHFGVGGFHRAHQAMYLDTLMNQGKALDWGIRGMGVMPSDVRMRDILDASDGLYTLVEKNPDGSRQVRVVGSIIDYIFAPEDPGAAIEALADPGIRIVSLTVTEGGYNVHPVTGEFDLANPAIAADLANPATPGTTFGLISAGLKLRRERGIAPFTVMSCDNIQGNGEVAHKMFGAFATALDAEFGAWVEANVPFPNSMVDRITPVTTDADRADVAQRYDIDDAWPVVCEDFTQWVLEDTFASGRPPYEEAGVQLVADVVPYELMKLRLLNATHQGLCYFGHLAGYRAVHEVARNPLFAAFLLRYMDEEATPTLAPLPGVDLAAYKLKLIERYSNEYVADTVARLCAESSDRIPKWLIPVVRENLAAGRNVELCAAIVASWARYAEGIDEQGHAIVVVDRLADELRSVASTNRENPTAFISQRELFGDIVEDEAFAAPYRAALASLHDRGSLATLESIMAGESAAV
ncbi:mannitol dehydrogenase family protein [Paeniglutamicibacter sp. Y32M11]|uniref:mannitol dehydrogenase family protein n=1 Tax=Paeniglutamicibacter sp. Y32M11 TaxID=2853258 RepID=UPI001C52E04D|nr:mannitol dehydrogenase family protein [Paeniglutamicibacter sp. Y32M11]QXQ10554.1 mannitol dehydrogenase family protein [Paeniglutamicibacter sp. Y32M11]